MNIPVNEERAKTCKHLSIGTRGSDRFQCNDCGKWFSEMPISRLKILLFDIETAPIKAFTWGVWNQNISPIQIIDDWFMLSWSAKWLNDNKMMADVVTRKEVLKKDDKRIVSNLYQLIDEADVLIAHYGNGFDIPKINTRFLIHGFNPPSPYQSIDTKAVASKQFGFTFNKLDTLATSLGMPNKFSTDFALWIKCLEGDQKSLDYMVKYNKQDVLVLEEVYYKMRGWIKNHPNFNIFSDHNVCSNCGSNNIYRKRGHSYMTPLNTYKTWVCEDCGAYSREAKKKLCSVAK